MNDYRKRILNYFFGFLIGSIGLMAYQVYAAKVTIPTANQTPQVMGAADANDNVVPIRANANGNISVQDAFGTVKHGTVTITGSGATDRTQGPNVSVNACPFKAYASNADKVYLGGSTVTNAAGASQGLPLSFGEGVSNVTLSNLNQVYFSTTTANDKVSYFCN